MIDDLIQLSNLIALLALVAATVAAVLAYPAFRQAWTEREIRRFRETRQRLVANRASLAKAAARLYDGSYFIPGSDYLTRPDWLMEQPLPLDRVLVSYRPYERSTPIGGRDKQIRRLLPRTLVRSGLDTYAQVVQADRFIKPSLFWNGLSYDLSALHYSKDTVTLQLGRTRYFDMFNVCEALAHEFAADRHLERKSLRRRIVDPTDLSLRVTVPALAWLMVLTEEDGSKTILLHARDGTAVASDGELMQVFGGQLQPSSRHAVEAGGEATLWQSFVREFAEELLGVPEAGGQSGGAISYAIAPFGELTRLRDAGELDVRLMGLGVDPLSNWPTFLCMALANRRLFGKVLPELVGKNDEGLIIGSRREGQTLYGFTFNEDTIEDLCRSPAVGAATVACLRLAWRNRGWFGVD